MEIGPGGDPVVGANEPHDLKVYNPLDDIDDDELDEELLRLADPLAGIDDDHDDEASTRPYNPLDEIDVDEEPELHKPARKVDKATRELNKRHIPSIFFNVMLGYEMNMLNDKHVRKFLINSQSGPVKAFLGLAELYKEGKMKKKWDNFCAVAEALEQVVIREQDETGRMMKGMRWGSRVLDLSILMRGYGAGSMQDYAIYKAINPAPSARHIK
jgi:hypothetical protein